jgi:Flp pilus assembly protein TadD
LTNEDLNRLQQTLEFRAENHQDPFLISLGVEGKPYKELASLALDFIDRGEFTFALTLLEYLTKKYPDGIEGFVLSGMALHIAGRDSEAMDAYLHALEIDPEDVLVLSRLGMLSVTMKMLDDAIDYFTRAIELSAKEVDPSVFFLRGLARFLLGRDGCRDDLREAGERGYHPKEIANILVLHHGCIDG